MNVSLAARRNKPKQEKAAALGRLKFLFQKFHSLGSRSAGVSFCLGGCRRWSVRVPVDLFVFWSFPSFGPLSRSPVAKMIGEKVLRRWYLVALIGISSTLRARVVWLDNYSWPVMHVCACSSGLYAVWTNLLTGRKDMPTAWLSRFAHLRRTVSK